MNKSKNKVSTNNLMVIAVVVGVLAVLTLVFAGRTLAKKIILEGKIVSKDNAANSQLDKNLAALPSLATNYQNLGNTKDLIAAALPTTADFPSIVTTAEAIAAASNVELDSVGPVTAAAAAATSASGAVSAQIAPTSLATSGPQTAPQSYGFTVAIKGRYADILNFAKNLQLSARPIKVVSLQLNGSTDQLTGTIQMNTFYYRPQALQDQMETVK